MKNSFKSVLFTLIVSLLVGCNSKKETPENQIDLSDIQQKLEVSSIIDSIIYVPLESKEECLMGNVSKIIYRNGTFFLGDLRFGKSVLAFDEEGKFKYKLHKEGYAPGEYEQPIDFVINEENEIVILDAGIRKIVRYDLNGKFIKEYPLSFTAFSFEQINKNSYAFSTGNTIQGSIKDRVVVTDTTFKIINSYLPIGNLNNIRDLPHTEFSKSNDLYFFPSLSNKIYNINEKEITEFYSVDFGSRGIPEYLFDEKISPMEFQKEMRENNYSYLLQNLQVVDDKLTFSFASDGGSVRVFYSLKTKNMYSGSFIVNNIDLLPLPTYLYQKDKYLFGIIEPYTILSMPKSYLASNPFPDWVHECNEYTNPIIAVYRLKNF